MTQKVHVCYMLHVCVVPFVVKSLFDDKRVTEKLKSAELPFLEDNLFSFTEQSVTGVTTEHSELLK